MVDHSLRRVKSCANDGRSALSQAKNRLSELVGRAGQGEEIGITRRGKLAAVIGPARKSA